MEICAISNIHHEFPEPTAPTYPKEKYLNIAMQRTDSSSCLITLLVVVRCFCFVYVSLFAVCSFVKEDVDVIQNLSVGNWLRDWQQQTVEFGSERKLNLRGFDTIPKEPERITTAN